MSDLSALLLSSAAGAASLCRHAALLVLSDLRTFSLPPLPGAPPPHAVSSLASALRLQALLACAVPLTLLCASSGGRRLGRRSALFYLLYGPRSAVRTTPGRLVVTWGLPVGYDSSLGAWHPLLHLLWACCGTAWASLWLAYAVHVTTDTPLHAAARLCAAALCCLAAAARALDVPGASWRRLTGARRLVSDPGGPREKKERRVPHWESRKLTAPPVDAAGKWECLVGEESHVKARLSFNTARTGGRRTISGMMRASFAEAPTLTGEPAGRQVWARVPTDDEAPATPPLDDDTMKKIDRMASGGRADGSIFDPSVNPNSCDYPYRRQRLLKYAATHGVASLPEETTLIQSPRDAARQGLHFLSILLSEDGHLAGDYGGPHFLLPGLVIVWHCMGRPPTVLDVHQRRQAATYFKNHQQSDGGWGTHIESPSTLFGTTMCYVASRILGAPRQHCEMVMARMFIRTHGGATHTSSWAKFYLCLLGVMPWEGHNPVPPEAWLLPDWAPFHPARMWCHARMVYLPMGYLYGSRCVYGGANEGGKDALIGELRNELYVEPYDSIDWPATRHLVADIDNYSPISPGMKLAQNFLSLYETWWPLGALRYTLRSAGLRYSLAYMRAEDAQTNDICIGPVNKVLNMLCAYHAADHNMGASEVRRHAARVADYLWVAEDGLKMQGYNGSQCWDTGFAAQAAADGGLCDEFPAFARGVWGFMERTQILSTEVSAESPAATYEWYGSRRKFYRHVSKGGWPFSTSAHGWPISDCTGEGLKAVLRLTDAECVAKGIEDGSLRPIGTRRLEDAVNVILTLQNEDGGWATYENNRGFGWYENLNPSEVFGDIMIDYSYVECSMASLSALAEFRRRYPAHRAAEVDGAVHRGRAFIRAIQRPDGSWYGSWACCFTYACWFGLEGLVAAGEPTSSPAVTRGVAYLLARQRPNGGWGEDFTSCYDKSYAADGMAAYGDGGSGAVPTAWALLALAAADCREEAAVRRGVRYLMGRQLPCGDWPQEGIAGVFNRACGITYTAYRNVFPIWALGRCARVYGDALDRVVEDDDTGAPAAGAVAAAGGKS